MQKIIIILFLFLVTKIFGQNQIAGKWLSEDKEGITEIYVNIPVKLSH